MATDTHHKNAGVLLHISSLPSSAVGKDAYQFIDFLASTGISIWQTLPINMPADDSPYQCISTHAGNPKFISLDQLVADGLLVKNEAHATDEVISIAYKRYCAEHALEPFKAFCKTQQFWLDDFSYFLLLRKLFNFSAWNTWPDEYKHRYQDSMEQLKVEHATALEQIKFTQFLFFSQWAELKTYAEKNHVRLFGDIPIFVAYDSADVWAQPHLFKLDVDKQMSVVAGVPPDYFSETGQRWGNPHYNWPEMEKNKFAWWQKRIATQTELFDLIRIDHFRGLEAAWEIPADEPNAIKGEWVTAPGDALLSSIQSQFPHTQLVAEDLGIITDEVNKLRLDYDLPGMKILQFAFGDNDENPYLPAQIEPNSVTYTGTHDNDTTLGWFNTISDTEKENLAKQLGVDSVDNIDMPYTLIEMALNTASSLVIIPMQDILELNSDHRMNIPGTVDGNWQWRFQWDDLKPDQINKFSALIAQSNRRAQASND